MLKAYRLKFLSKSTPIRAYTLFGAICWTYRLAGGDLGDFLKGFSEGNPTFLISSPLPIAEGENRYSLVFPKPTLVISNEFRREDDVCAKINRKPLKKAKYISFGVFKEIVEGKITQEKDLADTRKYEETGGVIVHASDKVCFEDKEDISVRNILNRITMESENLFTEKYHIFSDRWFLIKYYDESYKPIIEECFKLIEDTGLGANKNLGWGSVKIEPLKGFEKEVEYLEGKVKPSDRFISLSPLIPRRDSIDLEDSTYEYEIYKSPVDTTFGGPFIWKRKVLYLKEGAFITKRENQTWVGQVKDVGAKEGDLEVKAYQYGYEFPVAVEEE